MIINLDKKTYIKQYSIYYKNLFLWQKYYGFILILLITQILPLFWLSSKIMIIVANPETKNEDIDTTESQDSIPKAL